MNEKLLHFIWKYSLFDQTNLASTDGEKIEIVKRGTYNTHAGADFESAKIKIGKTLWAGNVEMHLNAKDWALHKHQNDKAYNNVILHVVYEAANYNAMRQNGEVIHTLELKGRIKPEMLSRYDQLSKRSDWIPCSKFIGEVNRSVVTGFMERLMVERLENKVAHINELLAASENDWENAMFQMIAGYLGTGINKEQFFALARSLPVKIWAKHQNDPLQIEALVFGQAGFLDEKFVDDYPNQLRKEYNYLKRLYQLKPLQKHVWKFLRLRPSNFPTIRLAQLAALMGKDVKLFSNIIEAKNAKSLYKFLDVEVNEYWKTHFQFDKPSKKVNSHIGADMKDILLINAVAPVLFAYGKHKGDEDYCDKAMALLETCKPESNAVITGWGKYGIEAKNASDTQALLQLKKEYCDKFRCLECAVGLSILK